MRLLDHASIFLDRHFDFHIIHIETRILQILILFPNSFDKSAALSLKFFGSRQSFLLIKPERQPSLHIFCRAIFILWIQPLDLCPGQERRRTATAKSNKYPRPGKQAHRRLRNGGAISQKDHGRIRDWDIPICISFLCLRQIEDSSILLHHAAFRKIINIGPLRMKNGLVFRLFHRVFHRVPLYVC